MTPVPGDLTTAHEEWDRRWRDGRARVEWSRAESVVADMLEPLHGRKARRVLDVGSGIGRHALLFARAGFDVSALDASRAGIDELRRTARARDLRVDLHVGRFTALPFAPDSFDYVLAWNVLYHGDGAVVATAFAEVRRVLRPGGWFQLTMLSKGNARFGRGREIRPDTFVDDDDVDGDKAHPHFYVDADGLEALLARAGLRLVTLDDTDQNPPHLACHWVALADDGS